MLDMSAVGQLSSLSSGAAILFYWSDKDDSCPTADLSNIGRAIGPVEYRPVSSWTRLWLLAANSTSRDADRRTAGRCGSHNGLVIFIYTREFTPRDVCRPERLRTLRLCVIYVLIQQIGMILLSPTNREADVVWRTYCACAECLLRVKLCT